MRPLLMLALAAALLPAGQGAAQVQGPVNGAAAGPSHAYVASAAASDMFEIQSSQIALQKARSPQVREFAQMMIDHHTRTSADLLAATRAARMPEPPKMLPADKAQKIEGLRAGSPTGFDERYMQEQLAGHREALALHQGYAKAGDNAELRQVAAKATPIVEQHLAQAQTVGGQVSGGQVPGAAR